MIAWVVLGAVWIVGPLLLTWRYVAPQAVQLVVGVAVLGYAWAMWTAIAANDSSTAAFGFVTMAPLAYAPPLVGWAVKRWRNRRARLPRTPAQSGR